MKAHRKGIRGESYKHKDVVLHYCKQLPKCKQTLNHVMHLNMKIRA